MRQRQRLGQVLVERQHAGDGAGDLRHLQAVGKARAVVVALVEQEHLGLVGEPPERGGVDDPVAVALEGSAHRAAGLRMQPPGAVAGLGGVGRHGARRPGVAAARACAPPGPALRRVLSCGAPV